MSNNKRKTKKDLLQLTKIPRWQALDIWTDTYKMWRVIYEIREGGMIANKITTNKISKSHRLAVDKV